ncbi:MAG: chemotaxis protein CheW [Burkholderiales bacterium]|nr:chemotaxis protein CheW [Burkholderiales bacterium]
MEFDLTKFFGAFFEEADEHLANLERLLLELDIGSPDPEDLNAIFRAAHSIKGGAGTFGFTDIAALTHILENLLDRVRKGTMRLEPHMVDLFLRAGDVLTGMIAVHRDGAEANPQAIEEVSTALKALEDAQAGAAHVVPMSDAAAKANNEAGGRWRLNLRLNGTAPPDGLLASLATFGTLIELGREQVRDTLQLTLEISSNESAADIADALAFVLQADQFDIAPADPATDVGMPVAGEGETFGFFDDDVPSAAPAEASEAFGFFDDAPGTTPAQAASHEIAGSEYGFFEPLPVVADIEQPGIEGVAYGYLDPAAAQKANEARAKEEAKADQDSQAAAKQAEPAAPQRRATDKAEAATIRVDVSKVDQLLNLVGELVITQSMLAQSASGLDPLLHTRLLTGIDQLERNTRELQESVMSIRMIPVSTVFSRFPRVVRDLAAKLGKKVELRLVGEQTELDKGFVEKLVDPLTHLVRNSLDHGIESTETRRQNGKSETGLLTLCAFHQGGSVVIEVRDDGAGLNRDRILSKARENGLTVSDTMTDQEVWLLIFEAGFSTAAEITDVSGRGVGMDVVRKNIQAMGGSVDIESMAGVGSTMRIRLPLTLAILDGMLVAVGGETYILPLNSIVESLQPTPAQCKTITGKGQVVQVREEYLPLVALHELVGCQSRSASPSQGIVVLIESGNQHIALWVDELLGQQQVVVKNLESNYRRVQTMSGATILGDGRVALIIDVSVLARDRSSM